MALGLAYDRLIHRYDSELFPVLSFTDLSSTAFIKISDWFYFRIGSDDPLTIRFPNRTEKACITKIHEVISTVTAGYTLDTDIDQPSSEVFHRDAGSGFDGAYYNDTLSSTQCSIQAKATSTSLSTGISLQNSDDTIVHNYGSANAVHSITLGQGGLGSIREKGSLVPVNSHFRYEVGDSAMIELDNGIVRYYLIKADKSMRLLRTTRSKLEAAPKAELLLYFTGSELQEVLIWNGSDAETSIEIAGVLENFQDWKNDFFHASTADGLQMANNELEFTFANSKTRLRTLTPALNVRQKLDRDDFLDFWNHHGIERDFLFVDNAHKDRDNLSTEFWAKFTSPFGDKALGSCLFSHASGITESYRSDIVLKENDNGTLVVDLTNPVGSVSGTINIAGQWTHSNGGRLKEFQMFADGVPYGGMIQNTDMFSNLITPQVDTTDFTNGDHLFYIIGYTFGGVSDQSNTITLAIDN